MSPITRSKSASAKAAFNADMNTYEVKNKSEDIVVEETIKKVISDAIQEVVQEVVDESLTSSQQEIDELPRVVNCDFPSLADELEAAQVLVDMKSAGEEFSGGDGGSSEKPKLTSAFMEKLIDVSVPFEDLLTPENRVKKKNTGSVGMEASVEDTGIVSEGEPSAADVKFADGIRHRLKKHRSEGDLDVALAGFSDGEVFLEEKKFEEKGMIYGNDIDIRAEVEMKQEDAYCVEKKMMKREFTVCGADGVVATLEGDVDVKKGDYIMKGSKGERWPLTPLKFRQTYTEKSVPEIYEYSVMAGGVFLAYLFLAIYFNFSNLSVNLISILYFAMFYPQKKIAIPKSKVVYAKQMREPFYVKVSWNDSALVGKADDYLLEYGIGDYGVVSKEIFQKTYSILE